jgi:hypothetical protein
VTISLILSSNSQSMLWNLILILILKSVWNNRLKFWPKYKVKVLSNCYFQIIYAQLFQQIP